MKKYGCIHPQLSAAIASCGHGDKILIADGNFPLASKCPDAKKVYLGFTCGIPTVTQVLNMLLSEVYVEAAEVMDPNDGSTPPIFREFNEMLGGVQLSAITRYEFYDASASKDVKLAISTGENRVFANILITVGVA